MADPIASAAPPDRLDGARAHGPAAQIDRARIAVAVLILLAGLTGLLLISPAAAAAPPEIGVRTGDHPGYGRVVFDLPPGTSAVPQEESGRVVVRFDPGATIRLGAPPPHNVRGITVQDGRVVIVVAPGAQVHSAPMDGKLVVDVLDPPSNAPAAQVAPKPAPPPPVKVASKPSPILIAVPIDRHDDDAGQTAAAAAAPAGGAPAEVTPTETAARASESPILLAEPVPSPADPAPELGAGNIVAGAVMTLAASPAPVPLGMTGHAVALPFDPGVGAAAFRRGASAILVFDERRPLDMAALRGDPVFAAGTVQLLPAATVLRLPLPANEELWLTRTERGWVVTTTVRTGNALPTLRPIRPQPAVGLVRLLADSPGQVVSLPDPDTGSLLLVGTQRQRGEGVAVARTAPEYALLPTWQGVAVEPVSDRLGLHLAAGGFVLDLGTGGEIALTTAANVAVAVADAHHFSRRYDFPALPAEGLRWRLQSAIDTAAAVGAQGRAAARVAVAQAMLALGMGPEAQSVLALAMAEDARLADDPGVIGLSAIAAMLAGRPVEANGIDDARLSGTDEIALWRAVSAAMRSEGSPQAAPVFAAELPLLLSYPPAMGGRLLPLAAETMALGGERAAAKRLLDSRPDDHALDLARAFLLQQEAAETGADPKPALDIYERLAHGPDRLVRARAAARAVELRLAIGMLTPAGAADALDKLMYSWRGDERELELRQRVAALRREAGEWRPALSLLRETAELWPEQKPVLHARMADIFAEALTHDAVTPLPPLDLVALAEENADLLPEGEAGQALAARLADRLVALDLPRRAVPVLEKLAASSPAGPVRAAFGDRLARMHLAEADAAGALAALSASDAPSLPAELLEARTLTFARAAAANGDLPRATAALAALDTTQADGLRAELLEAAKDWPAAEAALRDYAARTVPADGPLDESAARTLLRLASAAAESGDDATLVHLREHDTQRLPPGKIAEMFRLVTSGPIQGVADLPRARQDTRLAGTLPAALQALAP